ncbi:PHP domain-containing protein [Desulfuromonas sp. AOP6]|uniref:PHP domain-containing protein n=1 Tax=Desulfuromonas sp. AOP6 TaxID=1566351 RepID=UPI00128A32EC|nr:PHP domain-containing protein [Desulfuromonas sp. AOP6]BCA79216.1 phosphatase [Desulfuromonas sp. AOP6]
MNMKWVDLHLHSTCSDGLYSPEEVVRRAAEVGLAAVALADHDNIDGIEAAMAAGARLGVEVLSGVELSVVWQGYNDIHLLGYGFDHHCPELVEALTSFQDFRERRNELIVERVNEKLRTEGRAPLDFAEVAARAGGTLGRPHIAMALQEKGYVRGSEDAFQRYLIPCNVDKRAFPLDEAMALIQRAGGITVLAHPPFITTDRTAFLTLLDTFAAMGLDGVEAYNSGSSLDDIDWYITQARRRGLIVTGGSDFHGPDTGIIAIGSGRGQLKIPYRCVEDIRQVLHRRYGTPA